MSVIEDRAYRAFRNDEPGFYVVNEETEIAVAGPFIDYHAACWDMARRNSMYPNAPHPLAVWQVTDISLPETVELP